MQNQSPLVKFTIWFMVFLMSVGFLALVLQPFIGGNLFGNNNGREATQELLEEARADVRKDKCTDDPKTITGKREQRCIAALIDLGAYHSTLANPDEPTDPNEEIKVPKDSQRNIDRATDAYEAAYLLDPSNTETAETYAGYLREQGKAEQALPIWIALGKENPGEEDYLLQQAGTYSQTGDNAKAIATYKLFVKKFPDSGQIEAIKEEIKGLEDQAEASASGAGGAGGLPINVG